MRVHRTAEILDAETGAPFENADEGELVRRLDGLATRTRRNAAAVSHALRKRLG